MIFIAKRELDRNELPTNDKEKEFKRWLLNNIDKEDWPLFNILTFKYTDTHIKLIIETAY